MKMKSISGLLYVVEDLSRAKEFYQKLGFTFRKEVEDISATAYLNWFWIEFLLKDKIVTEAFKEDADKQYGLGAYAHISVEDVDEYYTFVLRQGLEPLDQPTDRPWGHREFVLQDPDGYKLVFFKKK